MVFPGRNVNMGCRFGVCVYTQRYVCVYTEVRVCAKYTFLSEALVKLAQENHYKSSWRPWRGSLIIARFIVNPRFKHFGTVVRRCGLKPLAQSGKENWRTFESTLVYSESFFLS